MDAPLCLHCRQRPVKRRYGALKPGSSGIRIIDDKKWRQFCSNRCASQARLGTQVGWDGVRAASHANRRYCQRRIVARLVAACKDMMDEQGKVDPRDFVKAMMRELRMQYQRQYPRRNRQLAGAA